jgi:hypothetical protein
MSFIGNIHPFDGGGQAINIGAAATTSSQLVLGKKYFIYAEADCYLAAGGSAIAATTSDFFFPAGFLIEYTPTAGFDYVSCIRKLTDVTSGLKISRGSL